MRKLGAAVLALPVLALVYLAVLGRGGVARIGAGIAAAVVVAMVVLAGMPPAPSNAVPAGAAPASVDARLISSVTTGHALTEPLSIEFDAPMDAPSVAASLRVSPDTAVSFGWDDAGRVLTIAPVTHWAADTLYTVTVAKTAKALDGASLATPVRAAVLTARAGSASLAATKASGGKAHLDTTFTIALDRPATAAAVKAALRTSPAIEGTVTAGSKTGTFVFTPSSHLAASASYTLSLDGLESADGVPFNAPDSLVVSTAGAPDVVRFRPRNGTKGAVRTSAISVRFTDPMNRAKTAAAFHVTAGGAAVKGRIAWAENGRVLVFVPAAPLPYGATVSVSVGATAVSKAGTPVADGMAGSFTVEAKPAPKPKPKPKVVHKRTKPITKPISRGGGGAVSGAWGAVETYYLRLMNCTRTGGWVTSKGSCSSPGGRNVAALVRNGAISDKVSRPYAKRLATSGICSHFVNGNPGDRLRRAGYRSYRWGENLGCRSGNPFSAVLGSHLYFQSERPYNGGHYRNLMDARFRQVGLGVWVSHGRVRLVIDFYTP